MTEPVPRGENSTGRGSRNRHGPSPRRGGGQAPTPVRTGVAPVLHFLLLFILAWVFFILWRGWLLPPVSHDALAYHLPKAVLFARAHGYEPLSYLDARIRNIPSSYEMLLAENIVLQHRDTITEWISTLFYVLFVIASAAIAERWWKSRATIVALFAAGVPVALLHSGAHKNDLMTAFFIVAALVACGRYISERDGKHCSLLLPLSPLRWEQSLRRWRSRYALLRSWCGGPAFQPIRLAGLQPAPT